MYGGTKTEMERLIKDASQMSDEMENLGVTVDANSMSFDNIINAISVMQMHLGIAGTTSKEASTTISGSINMMKASWQNMLSMLVTNEGDFAGAVNNLVESIVTVADNIIPTVQAIIDGVVMLVLQLSEKIVENLPQILDTGMGIVQSLIDGIMQMLPNLLPTVISMVNTLLQFIVQNLPTIIDAGIQIVVSLAQGIAESLPTLIPSIISAVLTIVDNLLANIDLIVDTGIQLIIGLAEGLIDALPQLIDKIPLIIDSLVDALVNNMPKIIEAGVIIQVKLAEGLIKNLPHLLAQIPHIIGSLVSGFVSYYGNLFELGKNLLSKVGEGISSVFSKMGEIGLNMVQGLWNGISNATDWILGKIRGFGESVLEGIMDFFGIHSPSTVFRDKIGSNLALGIGVGFEEEMKDVADNMASSIPTDFDIATNLNMNQYADNSFESQNISIINAFKDALSEMKIELDDETAGKFVDRTMTRLIYN